MIESLNDRIIRSTFSPAQNTLTMAKKKKNFRKATKPQTSIV